MSDHRTRAQLRFANGRLHVENGELREKLAAAMRVVEAARVWNAGAGYTDEAEDVCEALSDAVDAFEAGPPIDETLDAFEECRDTFGWLWAARAAALEEAARECDSVFRDLTVGAYRGAYHCAARIRALASTPPAEAPLTGPELVEKYVFRPHGKKAGV